MVLRGKRVWRVLGEALLIVVAFLLASALALAYYFVAYQVFYYLLGLLEGK